MTETQSAAPEGVADTTIHERDYVHAWFGLSYAQYMVLNRTVLQSMPAEWQKRLIQCLRELDYASSELPEIEYRITSGAWKYPGDVPEDELKKLGYRYAKRRAVVVGPDGEEHEAHSECVFVPADNPIPHYQRGRARVELLPLSGFAEAGYEEL